MTDIDYTINQCSFPSRHQGCYCAVSRKKDEKLCLYDKCRLDDQGNIKPIETVYKGYKFRSRLEARWAIFFDALGIKWEYEIEGYDLGGNIGYYLPDFYLPYFKSYLEIKPEYSEKSDKICDEFAGKINSIFLICGNPWEYTGFCYEYYTDSPGGGFGKFEICMTKDFIIIKRWDGVESIYNFERNLNGEVINEVISEVICGEVIYKNDLPQYFIVEDYKKDEWENFKNSMYENYKDSSNIAKRARFEFGETPNIPLAKA